MMCCRLNRNRSGSSSVSTIAKPEKMAPATKYGGKIVMCQNRIDVVMYVETANTSHMSGDRNCGHIEPMSFGIGIIHHANHGRPVWSSGNRPAAMTAKFVIASAERLMLTRQCWRVR